MMSLRTTLTLLSSKRILFLLLTRICWQETAVAASKGIPGTTQTYSGYDTELGEDPMCWSSSAGAKHEGGIAFPNSLVQDFVLADHVELLKACPDGTWLEVRSPPEFSAPNFHPRTLGWYNYTVSGRIDLSNLDGENVAADEGSKIAISLVACDNNRAGFCSPFVHEQSGIRLEREREEKIAAGMLNVPPLTATPPGEYHGGTHIHSPKVMLNVPSDSTKFDFDVQVPTIVNHPGDFFIIGTLQFFTGNSSFTPFHRYDVSNALKPEERLVIYQEPATILEVTKPVLIVSYVAIGIAGVILLFLIGQTIKHRNHQVLRISQGTFLVVFLLAALVAVVSCFLFEPRNDLWCNLSNPMIVISLHVFYSVALARLWRINAVVSPVLKNRMQHAASVRNLGSNSFMSGLWETWCYKPPKRNMRRTVSPRTSYAIVFASCLPQVVLQILAWFLQPQSMVIEFNESQSIGRSVCSDGQSIGSSIRMYALYLLLLLLLVLLIMGYLARDLPSLLNESAIIYDTTLLSCLLALLGVCVVAVTTSPTSPPDVDYLVKVFLVLSGTVNSASRITIPKLKMIWSGETIVVSELVAADCRGRKSKMSSGKGNVTISGLSHSFNRKQHPVAPVASNAQTSNTTSEETISSVPENYISTTTEEHPIATSNVSKNAPNARKRIIIRQGEEPSKRVVLKLLDLQHDIEHVTKQVMSGLNVEPQDWRQLRLMTEKMNEVFHLIDFDFDDGTGEADVDEETGQQ